jgi:hypothetical protein
MVLLVQADLHNILGKVMSILLAHVTTDGKWLVRGCYTVALSTSIGEECVPYTMYRWEAH